MGCTHYWRRPTELSELEFIKAVNDCKKIIPLLEIPLGGFDGEGDPIYSDDNIVFNGKGNMGCEPFEIARVEFDRCGRNSVMSFCKTNNAPYDICVKVALIVFKHHLSDHIMISSDVEDLVWNLAKEQCHEELGFGKEFSLDGEE